MASGPPISAFQLFLPGSRCTDGRGEPACADGRADLARRCCRRGSVPAGNATLQRGTVSDREVLVPWIGQAGAWRSRGARYGRAARVARHEPACSAPASGRARRFAAGALPPVHARRVSAAGAQPPLYWRPGWTPGQYSGAYGTAAPRPRQSHFHSGRRPRPRSPAGSSSRSDPPPGSAPPHGICSRRESGSAGLFPAPPICAICEICGQREEVPAQVAVGSWLVAQDKTAPGAEPRPTASPNPARAAIGVAGPLRPAESGATTPGTEPRPTAPPNPARAAIGVAGPLRPAESGATAPGTEPRPTARSHLSPSRDPGDAGSGAQLSVPVRLHPQPQGLAVGDQVAPAALCDGAQDALTGFDRHAPPPADRGAIPHTAPASSRRPGRAASDRG